MTRKAIIGIGNPLMTDDGIGITLLHRLRERTDSSLEGFEFIDLGTGGMTLLHHLAKLDRALIVDSGNMGLEPGEFRLFAPEEATSVKFLPGESLHEFDLMRAIDISKQVGEYPEKVLIFAVQPESIAWSTELTEKVASRVDEYEMEILKIVQEL